MAGNQGIKLWFLELLQYVNIGSRIHPGFYQGADKSLVRPGKKQAIATKLQLLQATQKKFRRLSVQPGLRGNDLCVGWKMANFQLFF